jgi:hypothetical protein
VTFKRTIGKTVQTGAKNVWKPLALGSLEQGSGISLFRCKAELSPTGSLGNVTAVLHYAGYSMNAIRTAHRFKILVEILAGVIKLTARGCRLVWDEV